MAELKFPTLEEFGRQAGEWALDEFEYKGLTIREWVDKITFSSSYFCYKFLPKQIIMERLND